MVDPYDLPRLLRQISKSLLRRFFAHHRVLHDFAWDDFPSTSIEPVVDAVRRLHSEKRREIESALFDIHRLADNRGMRLFVDEIQRRYPSRILDFSSQNGSLNKAMWAYLNLPETFGLAAPFARLDSCTNGCGWIKRTHLPRGRIKVDRHRIDGLQKALNDYYWPMETAMHCEIDYSDRANGSQYFAAYLDDWPEPIANNCLMHPCCRECLFWNAFLFNPNEGSLELIAHDGGATCLRLQQIFCRTVLGVDLGPFDPMEPAYRLGMLLEPGFTLATNPNDQIAQVCLQHVRIESQISPGPWEYQELEFQTQTDLLAAVKEIQQELAFRGLRRAQVLVREAAFQLLFLPNAQGNVAEMMIDVVVPNTCSLRSNPDELWSVGEHCLQLWGIACV